MKASIVRWFILLVALLCAVQAASAFNIKTETINPATGPLEPGQQVTARYVLTYDMATTDDLSDETFELSTGLQNPSWDITVYRDGIAVYTTKKTGYYPVLTEFEISYGEGDTELDLQLRGTVPSSTTGQVLIIKIEHLRGSDVKDSHSVTRDVVSAADIEGAPTTVPATTNDVIYPSPVATTGSLSIGSSPSGASVYVDGTYKGVTPLIVSDLSPGSHQVRLARTGYYDYTRTVSVTSGGTTPVSATLSQVPAVATTGSLSIGSSPSGASVYVDGTYKGVTPLIVSDLSPGSHQVRLAMTGYYDYSPTLFVTAGETTPVSATLSQVPAAATTGSLSIGSSPSGASVYVDGTYKGVTPLIVSDLSPGSHQVRLARTGYYDYTRTVSVTSGGTTPVSATLSQVPAAATTGSLSIGSSPSGASVYVDGTYKGVTPLIVSDLSPGSHQVRLAMTGYYDYSATRFVTAGETTYVSADLFPVKWLGLLLVVLVATIISVGFVIHSRNQRSNARKSGRGENKPPSHPDKGVPPGGAGTLHPVTASAPLRPAGRDPHSPQSESSAPTAKPDLTITLTHTSIPIDEWEKVGLTLTNTGKAPAFGIILTFSDDVETRWLRPVDLAAGESKVLEVGIKPRSKGNIPLEITCRYHDAENRRYEQVTRFWLAVGSRRDPSDSPIPPDLPHPLTPKSLPPEISNRYTESQLIGRGGFARVFKVKKPDGSWAALKVPISLDAATGKSFIAELQNWTSLNHENIVRVLDYNIMPLPYFEMELCDTTLADLEKPVSPEDAAWLIFNVCEGLKYAHARGIIHRDLKPHNILLKGGVPKISDWGLSKVMAGSRTATVSGGFTAYYAAPEQIANKPKGQTTDIWQIGVILYELVTGRLPFTGDSMVEIGMGIATKAPERPGAVNPDAQPLDGIILKCLEKDSARRYQSVADLQKDLAAYLKISYLGSLKDSIQLNDLSRSAYYCGDLVLISMKIGDLAAAYKYSLDLIRYSRGDVRAEAQELSDQIRSRVEMKAGDLPVELIQKAEVIVHRVRME